MNLNIERETSKNTFYRKVIYTDSHQQIVLMCLIDKEDIPKEKHIGSQFFRVEEGKGTAVIGSKSCRLKFGSSLVVPKHTEHCIKKTSKIPLKFYSIYSPPQHKPGTVHMRQPKK